MLVLTRKLDEQIQIGDDVVITILRVKGNTVRIGIEAPTSTRILRAELPPHGARPVPTTPQGPAAPATDGGDVAPRAGSNEAGRSADRAATGSADGAGPAMDAETVVRPATRPAARACEGLRPLTPWRRSGTAGAGPRVAAVETASRSA